MEKLPRLQLWEAVQFTMQELTECLIYECEYEFMNIAST